MSRDAVFSIRPYTVLPPSTSPSSTVMTKTKSTTFQLTTRKTKNESTEISRPLVAERRCSRRPPVRDRASIAVIWVTFVASTFLFLVDGRTSATTVAMSDGVSREDAVETLTRVDVHNYESPTVDSIDGSSSSSITECSQNVPERRQHRQHRRGHGTSSSSRERRRTSDKVGDYITASMEVLID